MNFESNESIECIERPHIRWPTSKSKFNLFEGKSGKYKWITSGFGDAFPEHEGPDIGYNCELFIIFNGVDKKEVVFNVLLEITERILNDPSIVTIDEKTRCIPFELQQRGYLMPPKTRTHDGSVGTIVYLDTKSDLRNDKDKNIKSIGIFLLTSRQLLEIRLKGISRCRSIYNKMIKK